LENTGLASTMDRLELQSNVPDKGLSRHDPHFVEQWLWKQDRHAHMLGYGIVNTCN